MSFTVSALADYTNQNEAELVTSSVLGAKTAKLIQSSGNIMVGVKSSETVNIMETDAFFQAGGSCGFNASGTTTFSQRTLTIGKIKINEALCPKALEAKYLQKALPSGSQYDSIPFEQDYANKKAALVAKQIEEAIWQSYVGNPNGNLGRFDGFNKLITDASASVIQANASAYISGAPVSAATGITASNVVAIFDGVYKAIPAKVVAADDMVIVCGMDTFRTYTIALKNANMFHYSNDSKADAEFVLPGTSIKVVALQGLNGTNKIHAMRLSNLFIGVDLLSEDEKFEIFYAKEADEVRYVVEFKYGVQFAFPDEITTFVLA